jgi:tripartite-type tricarboxylate transporter receptor subunit TctC
VVLAGGALVASSLAQAAAQAYPTRPVTPVIPFPPSGGNDALGRKVADRLANLLMSAIFCERPAHGDGR